MLNSYAPLVRFWGWWSCLEHKKVNFAQFVRPRTRVMRGGGVIGWWISPLCSVFIWNNSTLLDFTVKKVNFAQFYSEKSQHHSILLSKESSLPHFTVKIVNFDPFWFYCGKSQLCSILQWKGQLWSILILLWTESTLLHFDFSVNWVKFAPFWFYCELCQLCSILLWK